MEPFAHYCPLKRTFFSIWALTVLLMTTGEIASGQGFPSKNVNTSGPTPVGWLDAGNPLKQLNEPDCAVAPGQPKVVTCGMNDYSGVDPGSLDVPGNPLVSRSIGDAWIGISMSRDGGLSWIRGLHPCHLEDLDCSLGQKYAADPNLSAVPGALFYSFIAGWRDGTLPGGIYMSTWLENNAETNIPYTYSRTDTLFLGTGGGGPGGGGTFLDKPAQTESLAAGTSTVPFDVPDPNVPGATQTIEIPAGSIHFAHSEFLGNDNNPGTRIIYNRFDNYDFSNAAYTTKITESSEINQGATIATRNNGSDVLITWRRFRDNNEEASIMFVTCGPRKCTKPKVLADFCPHDQSTGRARFRTLALPTATSDGNDWYVFYSDRGDGDQTCLNQDGIANVNANGVEARLDYSRIMMATWDGTGNANWDLQPLDPQVDPEASIDGKKFRGHQIMPAATAAGGTVQVAWDDTRDSRLYSLIDNSPLAGYFDNLSFGRDRYIQDFVLAEGILRPASAYELDNDPPLAEGTPFRHSIDVYGAQINGGSLIGDSVKISRYPIGRSPLTTPPGKAVQLEHSFPNGRLFRIGSRPFYSDYKTVAARGFRLNGNMEWESNAGAPTAGSIFEPPIFYAGFTDNRRVRGNVYYDGCDENDLSKECGNVYEIPNQNQPGMMAPLEGAEDPSVPPRACTPTTPGMPSNARALSRNQNVFVAAIRPGLSLSVVSARKPMNATQDRTFVLYAQNSTSVVKDVTLSVDPSSPARFNRVATDPTSQSILITIPPRTGAVRTLFVDAGEDPDGIIVSAMSGVDEAEVLINGNIDAPLDDFQGVISSENYTLTFLGDRVVSTQDLENQDLENQDLENTVFLQDLENSSLLQDLENTSILQDLENQDLENLLYEAQDLENQDLENQDLENRALLFQDLENQDLENQDLENFTLLYQDLENQDLENGSFSDQPYTEISWPLKPDSNTTVGVNAKILAAAGSTDGLTTQVFVTRSYLTHTVSQNSEAAAGQYCTPQVVADNQVIYNAIIPGSNLNPGTEDPGLDANVVSFFAEPGAATTVTVRIYGDANFPASNVGLVVYAQAGDVPDCSPEIEGDPDLISDCEIDFEPDTTPPELGGVPATATFSLGPDDTTFTLEWDVNATDADPNLTVSCLPGWLDEALTVPPVYAFTHDFPLGDTIVACSASDSSENMSPEQSFTATVVDDTAPIISALPDINFEATSIPMEVDIGAIGTATASDAFAVTITNNAPTDSLDPPTKYLFPVGATVVEWTATDANGNFATATQVITVVDAPPVFSVVDSCTLTTADSSVTVVDWEAECPDSFDASDAVDGQDVTIDCAPNVLNLGEQIVSCTATDTMANTSAAASLTVSVELSFIIEIDKPKGNIKAGSTVPIDFRYLDSSQQPPQPIDSSGFAPSATWAGYSDSACTMPTGMAIGSDDAGSSSFRYGHPNWQYSWKTPADAADGANRYLLFTVMPPATPTNASTVCVRVR